MRLIVGFFSMEWLRVFDFLAPLAIRLLLVPILWISGSERIGFFAANSELLMPNTWVNMDTVQINAANFPDVFGIPTTALVLTLGLIEVICAILLLLGFATRWAALAVLFLLSVLIVMALGDNSAVDSVQALAWEHGYISQQPSALEILLTYAVLTLSLFFMGAGRWFSLDWYIYRHFTHTSTARSYKRRHGTAYRPRNDIDPFEIDATDEPGLRAKL